MGSVSAGGRGKNPSLGTVPGDRGDSVAARACQGVAAKKSPAMPGMFKSTCSAGYDTKLPIPKHGNIRR